MNQYIALIRLSRSASGIGAQPGSKPLASHALLEKIMTQRSGVSRATHDPATASMLVWFERDVLTVADLVRLIEEIGVSVSSIAQARADVASAVEAVGA